MWRTTLKDWEYKGHKPYVYVDSGSMDKFGSKFWVAKITGKDDKFQMKRDFLSKSGAGVRAQEAGVYEVYKQYGKSNEERYFFFVEVDGENVSHKKISKEEALDIISGSSSKKASCSSAAKKLRNEKSKSAAKEMRCKCSPLPPCKDGLAGIGHLFGPHKK